MPSADIEDRAMRLVEDEVCVAARALRAGWSRVVAAGDEPLSGSDYDEAVYAVALALESRFPGIAELIREAGKIQT